LVVSVFVAAVCGLVYELLAGTLSSYLLGDSVTQFSIVIGLFMTAMGVGSYLSRFIAERLWSWFASIEIAIGLLGGLLTLVGFLTFAFTNIYQTVLVSLVTLIGVLVGMEIPLALRLLKNEAPLRTSVSSVLSADYLGALVAALAFPFLIVPHLGLVRGGLVTGLANVLVGTWVAWRMPKSRSFLIGVGGLASAVLLAAFLGASSFTQWIEDRIYDDEVIFAENSAAQRIVITRWREDIRLYLNGQLQFSSIDEYRYHESLVLPAMAAARQPKRVLILGGGDGLALAQVLRHDTVEAVTLVDLDARVIELFRERPMLNALNARAFSDPRVDVVNTDASKFLETSSERYDVVVMDLPDPSEPALGKLYARSFFELVGKHLSADGVLSLQATSPFRSREAFWTIVQTVEGARLGPEGTQRFSVTPYHALVPSFGTWGFVLASPQIVPPFEIKTPGRFLTSEVFAAAQIFPDDMARVPMSVSELDDPVVVERYRRGYHKYLE
ncbi:MAG: polyamine aminopropyltransferase, partial [Myxococcota bacterium]